VGQYRPYTADDSNHIMQSISSLPPQSAASAELSIQNRSESSPYPLVAVGGSPATVSRSKDAEIQPSVPVQIGAIVARMVVFARYGAFPWFVGRDNLVYTNSVSAFI